MYSAKLSLSQSSSHHLGLTRSPNHIWAISCSVVSARCMRSASVTRERKIIRSLWTTQATFSIAPDENSGT